MRALRCRTGLLALAAGLAALALPAAPRAGATVYWAHGQAFGAVDEDGAAPVSSYPYEIRGMVPGASICGLAVDATDLYWADQANGAIGRMQLPPAGRRTLDILKEPVALDESIVAGLVSPCGVAVDSGHVYWADGWGLAIGRANLDGSGAQRNFITGAAFPCGVAVDGDHVYWANLAGNSIGRADLAGGAREEDFITGADQPCGVAVDSGHVYWGNTGGDSIGRATTAGTAVEQDFVPAQSPCAVAVDDRHLFWSSQLSAQIVGRAALDGSSVVPALLPGESGGCGIAVDSRALPPPRPQPSYPFFLGRGVRSRRPVSITYRVKVPAEGVGEVSVLTKGLDWRVVYPDAPVREGGYLIWELKVWPGRKGAAARRIRKALRRHGRVSLTLVVRYQEYGKSPSQEIRALTLVGARRHTR
jgi:virginiamycin B lyase